MRSTFTTKIIEQQDKEGTLFHQLYEPERSQGGLIIVFPAFEGWSRFLEEYAEFFASKGFVTLAADYYGQRQSGVTLEECSALASPYLNDRAKVRGRAIAIFDYIRALYPHLHIGAMGFCFGVQFVLELARTQIDLKAAAGAHGLLARSELASNKTIKSAVLMMQGYSDPMVPSTDCLDFAAEMEAHDVQDWSLVFFGKAQHSFTDPKTGTFNPEKERQIGRVFDPIAAERVQKWSKHFFQQILQKS